MACLEHITVGAAIIGLAANETVEVVAVRWFGNNVIEVSFKDSHGCLGNQLVYRENQDSIKILSGNRPYSFDGDSNLLRLASEAYRISLAYLFDPYSAVHSSAIEALPHQISAVYENMLQRMPLRYILADDPGAGKTIMTGLYIKELIIRSALKRCLIVSPGSLAEQWQDELFRKFNLRFEILTNEKIESSLSGNVFAETNLAIVRLDKLARNEGLKEKLKLVSYDLIVVDEAHKMSATVWSGEIKYTKRFQVGRLLSNITQNYLLLTATPHNGKNEDFQLFLSLIDPDRFEGAARSSSQAIDVSDVMRRLVKEDLLKFDGTPLFPERLAYTVNYSLSPLEAELYEAVTGYVQEEFNRADKLTKERKSTVGFALTVLQRRLASSPEAIYQSLYRRRQRLEHRLQEEKLENRVIEHKSFSSLLNSCVEDDLPSVELEEAEETIADQASAASTIFELEAEIKILYKLEQMANRVRASGEDRKWGELSRLLQNNGGMFNSDGQREKLIIFTEHTDTLRYLSNKIRSLFGSDEAVEVIHGGMLRDERRKVEERFKQSKNVHILVATDAAGEGINLQRAHLMINYDIPWNPNRLEQRFGRIHRIGQTEVCCLWNLVSNETREGAVFQRLFQKLNEERTALGGKVFNILGKITFDNLSLRDLLIEAVRYGSNPNVRARLHKVVDHSLNQDAIRTLLKERALTKDAMDISKLTAIRKEVERFETHKLQPHFIEAFFVEAFKRLGGKIHPREHKRCEITFVPFAVRSRDMQIGFSEPVLKAYERVCFDKKYCSIPGLAKASLICPGHPLLEAVIDIIREQSIDIFKRSAVFVDENDYSCNARLLFYIEDSVQNAATLPNRAKRIISKRVSFVEIKQDGSAQNAGYAPYLDYRAPTKKEQELIRPFIKQQNWLNNGVEQRAKDYAIKNIIPAHLNEVKNCKHKILNKIAKAVKERLTAEIQYYDYRAAELKNKESAGKKNNRLSSQMAAKRAEELALRMRHRLAQIENEKNISSVPPIIVGSALVVGVGLLKKLADPSVETFGYDNRKAIENAAMKAVLNIEASLGFVPHDVSEQKLGYDIESEIPKEMQKGGSTLRFIEVKGRQKGANSVTVSKNEILTGLNKPEEFILAIVEVDNAATHTVYLKKPFRNAPDFTATSINFDISNLIENSEILYRK